MTRLDPSELRTFRGLQSHAPFRLLMRATPNVYDVETLLSWFGHYLVTVDAEIAKLREVDADRARAAVVLRGLRQELANAVDTIRDLDAQVDTGTLEAPRKLASDEHFGPYGVGPLPGE